jgi:hypothetical protein
VCGYKTACGHAHHLGKSSRNVNARRCRFGRTPVCVSHEESAGLHRLRMLLIIPAGSTSIPDTSTLAHSVDGHAAGFSDRTRGNDLSPENGTQHSLSASLSSDKCAVPSKLDLPCDQPSPRSNGDGRRCFAGGEAARVHELLELEEAMHHNCTWQMREMHSHEQISVRF